MNNNKYGICCIVLSLEKNNPPQKFQRITYKKFAETPREDAINLLSKRILNNINVTFSAIKYCYDNNNCYRMSSDLFPLMTYDKAAVTFQDLPDYQKIKDLFDQIKSYLSNNKVRCSMHPDQFVVIASEKQDVVSKSLKELEHHAFFMDSLGLPQSYESPMNIHMNCYNGGNLKEVEKRFIDIFENLPNNIKSRLVLEIEDKKNSWSLEDLYSLYKKTKIPITYDSHHFRLNNPSNLSPSEAIQKCISTWGDHKPLFHFSNGKKDPSDRAHSEYVYELHNELFEFDLDIDFEFKAKDLAVKDFENKKDLLLEGKVA